MALFTTSNYPVMALIEDIDHGKIGLPDLQRPFVWSNVSVRDLLDSLYRGYPAGFLLFWETGVDNGTRGIGTKNEKAIPRLAIVDGQQRLTSLYAVVKGVEVLRSNFKRERIQIAFNPLSQKFEVADAAIRKDKAYIPDISVLWQPDFKHSAFRREFLEQLRGIREISDDEAESIEDAIDKLRNLIEYNFVTLTLTSSVDHEVIAEVFVRINGRGKRLNQADFIMTLMSVFWDEGRADLERFARAATRPSDGQASPFNHFIKPSPDQLLRVTVGVSLKRARLENVYAALRGVDAVTGIDDPAVRDAQFEKLRNGQDDVLSLTNWHHFLDSLKLAGYRSSKMISSETTILYSYVLYLIGLRDYGLDRMTMRKAIAEFYFMSALTGRYTNSPETRFESDLARIREASDGESYLNLLREICSTTLTGDYWTITLPNLLATSASRSPSLFAYQASLILLDANVLYSPLKISTMIDPAVKGTKAALEQHHLFPRKYLEETGIGDIKQINQIANFAPVEWPANIKIGKASPSEYVPKLDNAMNAEERTRAYEWHALPHLWWEFPYQDFLKKRRELMAKVIQQAWSVLTNGAEPTVSAAPVDIANLIAGGETDAVEFKSTLRMNLHTRNVDDKMQVSALKTIAGFLNANGGTLLIGVSDNGDILGLEADGFPNEDRLGLHLTNLIRDRVGDVFLPYIHPHFEDHDGVRVLAIRTEKGPKPAFVKDGALHRFYVRGGNATLELSGASLTEYVKRRFD